MKSFHIIVEFTKILESESDRSARTIQRYLVTDIVYGQYAGKNTMLPEKVHIPPPSNNFNKEQSLTTYRSSWLRMRKRKRSRR